MSPSLPLWAPGHPDTAPASSGPTPDHSGQGRVRNSLLTCKQCCFCVLGSRPALRTQEGKPGEAPLSCRHLPPGALHRFPTTGRPLGSAPGCTLSRRSLRASSPAGDSCSGSLLFLHTPARGHEVDGRFGDTLALRIALASSGHARERFFLPAFCPPSTLPTSDSFFPNP